MKDVHKLEIGKDFVFLNTGSPHYCIFVHDADKVDVLKEGRKIRYSDLFAEQGTNVNFIEPANDVLKIRTYERGVENETLSCGTGVTAAVLAASVSGRISGNECTVITQGGALKVNFIPQADGFSGIWLEGPATPVFKGQLII
jgi:diaminopimelate epimerase